MKSAIIDVSPLIDEPGAELDVSGELAIKPIKLGEEPVEFKHPFKFSFSLTNAGEGIVIRGRIDGEAELRCGRCLESYTHKVGLDVDEIAFFDSDEAEEEAFAVKDTRIDLEPIIYQNVMVDIPMRPLCRDDCAGLCGQCGLNLNEKPHKHEENRVDERWSVLKDWFNEKEGS